MFSHTKKNPVVVIACKVFQGLLEQYLPEDMAEGITFLDYGLHQVPKNLTKALQEQIDGVEAASLIVLGYGLCGNGLDGIKAGKHTLVAPRVDDCIAILLGSYEAYKREFDSCSGTYYLSKGWLESGSNPLQEYHEYVKKYGEEKAKWLMDMQYKNYKRVAFVAHEQADLDKYRSQAKEVAEYCAQWGMRYEEILGSNKFVQEMAEIAVAPEEVSDGFLVIPPGEEILQRLYWR